jgi:predicted NBD/HSP70 family sugar kinase
MPKIILEEEKSLTDKGKRNINILEVLRRYGPISRPDISSKVGMNVVTISHYIDDFIKYNFVYEKELDISEGGRRPVLLDLNPKAAYAIGVGLNLRNMVGILVDLKGNIITKTQIERPGASVRDITECIVNITGEILKRSKEYMDKIKGIGIGIAGLVNKKDNSIHWPEKIDNNYTYASVNIPLKDLMEKEFNLPTVIENDATAACFGEKWLSLDPQLENVLYMFSGVGCGIMINGEIYTGTNGCAGETAIHNYKEHNLFNCSLGNPCFLKRWEMDLGIVGDVKKRVMENKSQEDAAKILELANMRIDEVDLNTVFMANHKKNAIAQEALDTAAKRLGIKIAYLVNLLNPQIVIIGGGLEEAGEEFLDKITRVVKEWTFRETSEDLKIIYSQLRENAVAQGSASLVMRHLFAHL